MERFLYCEELAHDISIRNIAWLYYFLNKKKIAFLWKCRKLIRHRKSNPYWEIIFLTFDILHDFIYRNKLWSYTLCSFMQGYSLFWRYTQYISKTKLQYKIEKIMFVVSVCKVSTTLVIIQRYTKLCESTRGVISASTGGYCKLK